MEGRAEAARLVQVKEYAEFDWCHETLLQPVSSAVHICDSWHNEMIFPKQADGGWDLSHDHAGNNMGAAEDGTKTQTVFITLSDLTSELA